MVYWTCPDSLPGEWTARLSAGNATPVLSRHSFPWEPIFRKKIAMLKELKEAPKKAMQLSLIALGIAILALFVSLGKR